MSRKFPQVLPNIAGSKVVVYLNSDTYIDARADIRKPEWSTVEFVSGGQCRSTVVVRDDKAAEYIINLMRMI